VGTQGGKKSLQVRFFAAASPSASALAGFPPKRLTQERAGGILFALIFWDFCIKTKVRRDLFLPKKS
jgi:hypothetical protein